MTRTTTKDEVLDALSGVRDPELDEPITSLGFVSDVKVEASGVSVTLRLPTFFCSPNFAYIMAEDSKRALLALPLVRRVRVIFEDFHVSQEINAGISQNSGFDRAFSQFSTETSGQGLEEVRDTFRRKAFIRRQEILCRKLLAEGAAPVRLARMTLGEVGPSQERDVYVERRAGLGFDTASRSPLLLTAYGSRVPEKAAAEHLKKARLTRVSVEGNGTLCQELLHARYAKRKERLGA